MTDEIGQFDESPKPFRWWLIPAIIAGFIGSLAVIAGSMIAYSIIYDLQSEKGDPDYRWMMMTTGTAVVVAYLTLGGCLLVAAGMFWNKKMKIGLLLVGVGVLVMSLAVMLVS